MGLRSISEEEERYLVVQCESLRRYVILGVGMSMLAAFVCILSIPFVYNYLQNVQSLLSNEADYCKVSLLNLRVKLAEFLDSNRHTLATSG